jgi:hypothetical protein
VIDAPMPPALMLCNKKSTSHWLILISTPGRGFSLSVRNIPNLTH